MKNALIILFVSLFFFSCKQSFEPNGKYDDRMIVFSILRMDTDTQYVRVYRTYDPANNNPLTHSTDTEINNATVTITDGTTIVPFHDTLIVRADTATIYGKYVHTYIAYKLSPKSDKIYTLTVSTPGMDTITATAKTFTTGSVSLSSGVIYQTLSSPKTLNSDTAISVIAQLGKGAPVYMVRFMLKYKQYIAGLWKVQKVEIPYYIKNGKSYDDFIPYYPSVMIRGQNDKSGVAGEEVVSFSKESYVTMVRYLTNTIGPDRIEFDGAYFSLTQLDQSVFSYYSATNQVSDNISIRLDQVDYSNIEGGHGLFGISTYAESNYIKLPQIIDVP